MGEDQTERLINLIRSRPALYDKRLKDYADRSINKTLWKEVSGSMIDTWNLMSSQEKILKIKEIQQRWQNLRTCFKRELNKCKSGQTSKKRRKYIYYNQLQFLLSSFEESDMVTGTNVPGVFVKRRSKQKVAETTTNQAKSNEKSIINLLKKKNNKEEIDEDECFLLSLVPSLRRMTDDQKIQAKMGFLATIQRLMQPAACSTAQPHQDIPPSTMSPGLTQPSQEMISSTPAHTDSSRGSFISSNAPTSTDFIEINQLKIE